MLKEVRFGLLADVDAGIITQEEASRIESEQLLAMNKMVAQGLAFWSEDGEFCHSLTANQIIKGEE